MLAALNRAFPMEQQNGKYFTMFYGIYNPETREMVHASGGHPPAIAIAPDGAATAMSSTGMMIGAFSFATHRGLPHDARARGRSCMCSRMGTTSSSDGSDEMMTVADFSGVLAGAAGHGDALDRILAATQEYQRKTEFDDDFSLVEFQL